MGRSSCPLSKRGHGWGGRGASIRGVTSLRVCPCGAVGKVDKQGVVKLVPEEGPNASAPYDGQH